MGKKVVCVLFIMFCLECSARSVETTNQEANVEDVCGRALYTERIKLTQQRIVTAYKAPMVLSPFYFEIKNACVGMSFAVNQQGKAFDMVVMKTSHPGVLNRAAKKALKKYRFKEGLDVFKDGYLVIEFASE